MVKDLLLIVLFVGGLLSLCTGCVSTNSHENLKEFSQNPQTVTSLTMPSGAISTECPVPGNTSLWIRVDPIALNHSIGEPLRLSGTTNIKTGEQLRVHILPPIRGIRTREDQYCDTWEGVTSVIQRENCSVNTWFFSDSNLTRTISPSCPSYTIIITDVNNTINGGEDYIRIVRNSDLQ